MKSPNENAGSNGGLPQVLEYTDPKFIIRSPFNREIDKDGPELEEMIETVKVYGVIEPLLVRLLQTANISPPQIERMSTAGIKFELIAGERRWKAARQAKLERVPIIVRQASDREVIELQTIENDQRLDLSPIERAQKYQQLLEQYAKDDPPIVGEKAIALLCEKVGRKKSAIYDTMRLLKLPEPIREAVSSGKLPASHAGLIAKLDDAPEVQERISRRVLQPHQYDETEGDKSGDGAVLAFRELRDIVRGETKLAPARAKWLKAATEWKAKGGAVMTEDAMEKAIGSYGSVRGGWLDGAAKTTEYTGCGQYPGTPFKSLMGKQAPPATLAHNQEYKILELYPSKLARKAVQDNGHKRKPRQTYGSTTPKSDKDAEKQRKEREARAKRMQTVGAKASELLLQAATKSKPKFPWSLFLDFLDDNAWTGLSQAQIKKADSQPLARILAILLQAMLGSYGASNGWEDYRDKWAEDFVSLCKHYKIDLVKLEKQVATAPELKPKVQASGKKGGKK